LGTDFDRKSKRKAEKDNAQHTRPPSQVKQKVFGFPVKRLWRTIPPL
jgi:hypothetical protein